jgi:hypothetical protein
MTAWFDPLTRRQLQPPGRGPGVEGILGDPFNAPGSLPCRDAIHIQRIHRSAMLR